MRSTVYVSGGGAEHGLAVEAEETHEIAECCGFDLLIGGSQTCGRKLLRRKEVIRRDHPCDLARHIECDSVSEVYRASKSVLNSTLTFF
jgi:hypothetical protein